MCRQHRTRPHVCYAEPDSSKTGRPQQEANVGNAHIAVLHQQGNGQTSHEKHNSTGSSPGYSGSTPKQKPTASLADHSETRQPGAGICAPHSRPSHTLQLWQSSMEPTSPTTASSSQPTSSSSHWPGNGARRNQLRRGVHSYARSQHPMLSCATAGPAPTPRSARTGPTPGYNAACSMSG